MRLFKNLSPGVGGPVLCVVPFGVPVLCPMFFSVFLVAFFSVSCPQELRMAPRLHSPVAVDQQGSAAKCRGHVVASHGECHQDGPHRCPFRPLCPHSLSAGEAQERRHRLLHVLSPHGLRLQHGDERISNPEPPLGGLGCAPCAQVLGRE